MTSRLNRELPPWSRGEYERRLLAQAIAWDGGTPLGRGMVLFPEHEEYSESAARERCAEAGDVQVPEPFRRRGVASALMRSLEDETRAAGFARIGLSVSEGDDGRAARALYERLGYRHAHGPYIASTRLEGDDGPFPVGAVLRYLVKEL